MHDVVFQIQDGGGFFEQSGAELRIQYGGINSDTLSRPLLQSSSILRVLRSLLGFLALWGQITRGSNNLIVVHM